MDHVSPEYKKDVEGLLRRLWQDKDCDTLNVLVQAYLHWWNRSIWGTVWTIETLESFAVAFIIAGKWLAVLCTNPALGLGNWVWGSFAKKTFIDVHRDKQWHTSIYIPLEANWGMSRQYYNPAFSLVKAGNAIVQGSCFIMIHPTAGVFESKQAESLVAVSWEAARRCLGCIEFFFERAAYLAYLDLPCILQAGTRLAGLWTRNLLGKVDSHFRGAKTWCMVRTSCMAHDGGRYVPYMQVQHIKG